MARFLLKNRRLFHVKHFFLQKTLITREMFHVKQFRGISLFY